jgi:hypothetical protein
VPAALAGQPSDHPVLGTQGVSPRVSVDTLFRHFFRASALFVSLSYQYRTGDDGQGNPNATVSGSFAGEARRTPNGAIFRNRYMIEVQQGDEFVQQLEPWWTPPVKKDILILYEFSDTFRLIQVQHLQKTQPDNGEPYEQHVVSTFNADVFVSRGVGALALLDRSGAYTLPTFYAGSNLRSGTFLGGSYRAPPWDDANGPEPSGSFNISFFGSDLSLS